MFPILLLQASWPTLHPLLLTLIGAVVSATLALLAAHYWRKYDARRAAHAAELAAAAQAERDQAEWTALLQRVADLETGTSDFMHREALETRFKNIEGRQDTQGAVLLNQGNTLHEYERKRTELTGEFRGGIEQLREKVHLLETMPGRVDKLEGKLDGLKSEMADLKQGQRDLKNELREDMRSNKNDILAAIQKLPH